MTLALDGVNMNIERLRLQCWSTAPRNILQLVNKTFERKSCDADIYIKYESMVLTMQSLLINRINTAFV